MTEEEEKKKKKKTESIARKNTQNLVIKQKQRKSLSVDVAKDKGKGKTGDSGNKDEQKRATCTECKEKFQSKTLLCNNQVIFLNTLRSFLTITNSNTYTPIPL